MKKVAIDLLGQRFGRLTVIERAGSDKHYHAHWRCQCDCGVHECFFQQLANGHDEVLRLLDGRNLAGARGRPYHARCVPQAA